MKFTKMHGIGNDYIYFDCTKQSIKNPEELSRILSRYHFGVGSDGVVLIMKSDKADFRMRMFNADGSEGKMCGNATRCIGKYVYERGLTDKTSLTLETLSGIKYLTLDVSDGEVVSISVNMGRASFAPEDIPVNSETPLVNSPITVDGKEYNVTALSVGNPHCVIFTDKAVDEIELEKIGPKFENFKDFPERINTEFVNVIDKTTLKMRVWERGSGETFACGTGACAVAAAAIKNGICPPDTDITVKLRGGDLKINCGTDGEIVMNGTATFVFDGEIILKEALQCLK